MSALLWYWLLAYSCIVVLPIPIDNGVEGDPEIECSASSITVSFNTRNEFGGHVYVKGRFAEEGCKNDEGGRRVASIKLGFDQCGTQRSRSLNPKGVTVTNTVVITFHPQFLTKVDRAYTIQCFYMEADKTVSQDLEVSEITTAFQTQTVPMPVCQYDILDGGPEAPPVKFATIGQQVYHKWTCTTETTDIFCAIVHSCFVDDGAGNHQQLLDENGCALDKFLLQNLEYPSDLMAGREAHVFKYADKPALFFQCQVTISIKEPGLQCPRPQCGEPGEGVSAGGSRPPPAAGSTAPAEVPSRTTPPGGSSPRAIGQAGARGLFIAPLQAILPSTGSAPFSARSTRRLSSFSLASSSPSEAISSTTTTTTSSSSSSSSSSSTSTTSRPPQSSSSRTTTLQPAAPNPPPAAPVAGPPPNAAAAPATTSRPPSSPRPRVSSDNVGPDQLNVPINLSPAAGSDAGGLDFPDRRRRARRSPMDVSTEAVAGVWDVRAQPITALDIDDDILDDSLNRRSLKQRNGSSDEARSFLESRSGFCLSPVSFGLFLAFLIAFSILTAMLGVFYCLRRSSSK